MIGDRMFISFFNTKGGAGKTSSAITLLSALAERNTITQEPLSVLALDADPQGSLRAFGSARADQGLPAYGIEFVAVDLDAVDDERVNELCAPYDVTIIDLPGFHHHTSVKLAAMSNAVLLPTHLSYIETRESMFAINQIVALTAAQDSSPDVALLLNRLEANLSFLSRADKEVLQSLRSKGFPILQAFLSRLNAFSSYCQLGKYPFELARDEPQAGNQRAALEARALLSCLENWALVPALSPQPAHEDVNHG